MSNLQGHETAVIGDELQSKTSDESSSIDQNVQLSSEKNEDKTLHLLTQENLRLSRDLHFPLINEPWIEFNFASTPKNIERSDSSLDRIASTPKE